MSRFSRDGRKLLFEFLEIVFGRWCLVRLGFEFSFKPIGQVWTVRYGRVFKLSNS